MSTDTVTHVESSDPNVVAAFVCNAVNGWTENPTRMLAYFTETGSWEFPYAPIEFGGFFKELKGPKAVGDYFTSWSQYMANINVGPSSSWTAHSTENPNIFIFMYEGTATIKATGKLYQQSYIAQVTLRDGKIQTYREYWNPYPALLDFGLVSPTSTGQAMIENARKV